jgi:hypothetical protein
MEKRYGNKSMYKRKETLREESTNKEKNKWRKWIGEQKDNKGLRVLTNAKEIKRIKVETKNRSTNKEKHKEKRRTNIKKHKDNKGFRVFDKRKRNYVEIHKEIKS